MLSDALVHTLAPASATAMFGFSLPLRLSSSFLEPIGTSGENALLGDGNFGVYFACREQGEAQQGSGARENGM